MLNQERGTKSAKDYQFLPLQTLFFNHHCLNGYWSYYVHVLRGDGPINQSVLVNVFMLEVIFSTFSTLK